MADAPRGNTTRLLLTLAAALLLVVVVIWLLTGGLDRDAPDETVTTFEAGVTDESGGELIVTDPDAPAVEDVELPETEMTPVPPGEGDAPPPAAEPAQ